MNYEELQKKKVGTYGEREEISQDIRVREPGVGQHHSQDHHALGDVHIRQAGPPVGRQRRILFCHIKDESEFFAYGDSAYEMHEKAPANIQNPVSGTE